jgi:hypothetical protein
VTCSWLLFCTTVVLGIWAWFDLKERRHKRRLERRLEDLATTLRRKLVEPKGKREWQ